MKRILLSQGLSVLHFPDVAVSIEKGGNNVKFITGWLPRPYQKGLLNKIGNLLSKNNLYQRLQTRQPSNFKGEIVSLGIAEAYFWTLISLAKAGVTTVEKANYSGWVFFGKSSKKAITNQDIFHVRSGAGQGGAISKAKAKGMVVIADHSIAHPASMQQVLAPEYAKFNQKLDLEPDDAFWNIIMKDCHQSDYILVNSDYVAKTFIENGVSARKLKVIYWGVRRDFLNLKTDWRIKETVKLIFTGTFSLRKGAHVLVDAIQQLNTEGVKVELNIAGPDEFTRFYKGEIPSNIKFLGNLLQDELKHCLVESDIYVFPTFAEGCARSVMEAMAVGLPVITTENSGAPIITNQSGFIMKVGDADSLVETIKTVITDHAIREKAGKNASKMVAEVYSWSNYAKELNEFYNEVSISQING